MSGTRRLLEEIQDSTDIALDFIENEIGGNTFVRNWNAAKKQGDVVKTVANWMSKVGISGDAQKVVDVIDALASRGTQWLTPFTSPIPPGDNVPTTK